MSAKGKRVIIVNSYWLHHIFATLGEGNEERARDIVNLNMINPSSIRKLVENHVTFESSTRTSGSRCSLGSRGRLKI